MAKKNYTASTIVAYSPQKSRLVINPLRNQPLDRALNTLSMMNKGKTRYFHKLLVSAAHNLGLTETDYEQYKVAVIVAEEAQKYYRIEPRARGSAFRIRKRYSRIKVKLEKVISN